MTKLKPLSYYFPRAKLLWKPAVLPSETKFFVGSKTLWKPAVLPKNTKREDTRRKTQDQMYKAQVWSADLVAASLVILFILLFFILSWDELAIRWNTSQSYRVLFTDALVAADALFTTPGDPPSLHRLSQLNENNLKAIGIVDNRNEINNLKLEKLKENNYSNYNLTKKTLGLERYEFLLTIMDIERNSTIFRMGTEPPPDKQSASIERFVIVNGSSAIGKLEVYSK